MRLRRSSLVVLIALSFAACGGGDDEAGDEESGAYATFDEGDDADLQEPADESDEPARVVVDPVGFRVLLAYLPKAPDGWIADEPQGSTTSLPEYKVSVVSGRYHSPASGGAAEQSISIEVTDGGFAETISASFQMMAMMSHESTDGYQKGVTVAGYPGYETWDERGRQTDLNVLVGDRFLVHLNGQQVEPDALREWAERMDLDELAGES